MRRFLLVIFLGVVVLAQAIFSRARAFGPDNRVLITWRPVVYVPPNYEGRVLPSSLSTIVASVSLIDGGKSVDLSGQPIYWYINSNFLDEGRNRQTVSFTAPERTGTNIDVRVELPDYKDGALRTITIPIVAPSVVIDAPFPRHVTNSDQLRLFALPYFFNVTDRLRLDYAWSVNGAKTPAENPTVLSVPFPDPQPGSVANVSLNVKKPGGNFFEGGGDNVSLVFNQ